MMFKLCSRCPEVVPRGTTLCPSCSNESEARRGSPSSRGYGTKHRKVFREGVLAKHPICVLCMKRPATVADHWPLDRRQLVSALLDPDDPQHGRGLCASCHGAETARLQPGGWHANR